MGVTKELLGMNARNFLYIRRYNKPAAKHRADDKLATKELLVKSRLATPKLLAGFHTIEDIKSFQWKLPRNGFVIKPSRGYGGGGILVIKSWENGIATTTSGETYTQTQLQSHLYDIFDGAYSLQFLPDRAYIESLVEPADVFQKISPLGVPDIRVIVFHKIPVMAMLRVPTEKSKGKANLHLGAIGVGIDLLTGMTTHAIYKNRRITYFPGTTKKISGIAIPQWQEILLLSSRAVAASQLGYGGVDIVIDEDKGPLILEINARPGLSIQNANLTSLRTRLERVEGMHVTSAERGVELAQSLFSDANTKSKSLSPKILTVIQPLTVHAFLVGEKLGIVRKKEILAKLDSGAYRTSIDKRLAKELRLPKSDKKVFVQSASGTAYRPTVELTFELGGKTIKTIASVVDRSKLKFPVIVGRRDLQGFLLQPDYGKYAQEEEDDGDLE